MNDTTTVQLKTTTGMMVSIEDYNSLDTARKIRTIVEDGILLQAIRDGIPVGLIVSKSTTIHAICQAAEALTKPHSNYSEFECRDFNGCLLGLGYTVEQLMLKSGCRLYISPRIYPLEQTHDHQD